MSTPSLYEIPVNKITGERASLADYRGKVLLIVNVASQCGLTPQYDALEKLYTRFKDSGFVVCGFPANDFGAQEPGSNEEIQTFCPATYGVDFPMFSKIAVTGPDTHPLYQSLIAAQPKAIGPTRASFRETSTASSRATTAPPPTPSPASSGTSKSSSSTATATSAPASPPKSCPTTQPSSPPSNPPSAPRPASATGAPSFAFLRRVGYRAKHDRFPKISGRSQAINPHASPTPRHSSILPISKIPPSPREEVPRS